MWWIGLRAHGNDHSGVEYVWDNGLPVTFTHWDRDQPGKCKTAPAPAGYVGEQGCLVLPLGSPAVFCPQTAVTDPA